MTISLKENVKMAHPPPWDLDHEKFQVYLFLGTIPELLHLLEASLDLVGMSGPFTRLKTPVSYLPL